MMFISRQIWLALASVVLVSCGGGGGGTPANFSAISGIALDNPSSPSKLIVANTDNQTIQSVLLTNSSVTVLAGAANTNGSTDGTAAAARFYAPVGITLSGSDYYVADTYNHAIRKVSAAGVVTTLAGLAGTYGHSNGTGTAALFSAPKGLISDGTNLFVVDTYNQMIRKVVIGSGALNAGVVTDLAGYAGSTGTADGTGSSAYFNYPYGITWDGSNFYVTDSGNHSIRVITPTGVVTTLAGAKDPANPGHADGLGATATFNAPAGIVNDPANRDVLYVADSSNHTIRKILISTGQVTTPYGSAGVSGSANGIGTAARFDTPLGLVMDNNGHIYVSDQKYTKIRKIDTATGEVTTLSASF
jgi:predicted nucleic acid-binding Zn ribbon protein